MELVQAGRVPAGANSKAFPFRARVLETGGSIRVFFLRFDRHGQGGTETDIR